MINTVSSKESSKGLKDRKLYHHVSILETRLWSKFDLNRVVRNGTVTQESDIRDWERRTNDSIKDIKEVEIIEIAQSHWRKRQSGNSDTAMWPSANYGNLGWSSYLKVKVNKRGHAAERRFCLGPFTLLWTRDQRHWFVWTMSSRMLVYQSLKDRGCISLWNKSHDYRKTPSFSPTTLTLFF